MAKKPSYSIENYSIAKMILADYNDVAASFTRVAGLVEIEITRAMTRIKELKEKEQSDVSFTGWVVKCFAKALTENKQLNSYKWRRKLICFDDVDISMIIEITSSSGKKIPYNHVVRKAQDKSVKEITEEIRVIENQSKEEKKLYADRSKWTKVYRFIPRVIRKFFIKKKLLNPFSLKKLIGTAGITSLGMFAQNVSGWAIPFADSTVNIAVGGISTRLIRKNEEIFDAKFLCMTFLFDHNVVDGAPATRFISRTAELMSNAYFLRDINNKDETI